MSNSGGSKDTDVKEFTVNPWGVPAATFDPDTEAGTSGPGLNDMAPIKLILKMVPLDYVLYAIRQKVDRRCYPGNPPLVSWRDPVFLRAVADNFCGCVLIPGMVKVWGEAGKASASSPPAGSLPDDIDRSHHDSEHAPPGPHSLASPARTTPDVARVAPMRPTR